jgi:hypothetical protein
MRGPGKSLASLRSGTPMWDSLKSYSLADAQAKGCFVA